MAPESKLTTPDEIALQTAVYINDIFAKGHEGGVAQRTAAVQMAVSAAIHTALRTYDKGELRR